MHCNCIIREYSSTMVECDHVPGTWDLGPGTLDLRHTADCCGPASFEDGRLLAKSSTGETVNTVRKYYMSEATIRQNLRF